MDRENTINIALIGEVSTGKTTLLNSMFIKTLSDMRRIRTTMSINIYAETTNKTLINSEDDILKINTNYEATMKDKKLETLEEFTYYVQPSISFGNVLAKKGYNLNIIDIPGLNDSSCNDLIRKWISNNFYKFDFVFFIINGEGAMNTESERKLLEFIVKNIELHPHVSLLNIINKYDDPTDEELNELRTQAIKVIKETIGDRKINTSTLAISAEKSYIYRFIEYNKTVDGLSHKHKNLISIMELGTKSKKYDDTKLVSELVKSINESKKDDDSCYNSTNYGLLISYFKNNIVANCSNIIFNKMVSFVKRENPITNILIDKYRKCMNLTDNKDLFFESCIEGLFKINIGNVKYITDTNAILNKNIDVIKHFCNYKTIKNRVFEWYDNYGLIVSTKYDNYLVNINEWFECAKLCDILDDEYIVRKIIRFYKNIHNVRDSYSIGLRNTYVSFDCKINSYFSHINSVLSTISLGKISLIQQFLNFLISCIAICDGYESENKYICTSTVKLALFEVCQYTYLGKYTVETLAPSFYLKKEILKNQNGANNVYKLIMSIPDDVTDVSEYIDTIDPGFKNLFGKLAELYQNKANE